MKSNICDYNDAYILVGGSITIGRNVAAWVAFKTFVPFTKINHKNWWSNNRWCRRLGYVNV